MARLAFLVCLMLLLSVSYAVQVMQANVTKGDVYRITYGPQGDEAETNFVVYEIRGGDAPFIELAVLSEQGSLQHGEVLPGAGSVLLEFDGDGLRSIRVGGVPANTSWVNLSLTDPFTGANYTQTVYSQEEGYEAQFTPPIPLSASYHRIFIEFANQWWALGQMNKSLGTVVLYKEGAYGRLKPGEVLAYGDSALELVNVRGNEADVRVVVGLVPTTMSVQAIKDPQKKAIVILVQYNSSIGPVDSANCYLSGDVSGPLAYADGYYRNYFGYAEQQKEIYQFDASCFADLYQPQTAKKKLNISAAAAQAQPGASSIQPPAQPGIPYQPVQPPAPSGQQKNIIQQLIEFLAGIIRAIFGGK